MKKIDEGTIYGIIIVIGCVVSALIVSFILVSGFTMLVAWLLGFLEVMTLKKSNCNLAYNLCSWEHNRG